MAKRQGPPEPVEAEALSAVMEQKKAVLDAMKLAYFHRAPFGDAIPDEQTLKDAAEQFIAANYAYQKYLYGRVRVRLAVANLLR